MGSPLDQLSEECNRLVFEAVNEDSLSKLQLVNRTYSPNQLLTSLAQRNEGETPLEIAMKRKNVPVFKEMVNWIFDHANHLFHKKECKSMPIFIIDQLSHHIPVLESDEWYNQYGHINDGTKFSVYRGDRKNWLRLIGVVLLKSTSLTGQDKIIALELIGALAIIHCYESMTRFALKCWREAMALRYFPQDGEPLLPKVPAICVPTQASSVIFGSAAEIMTMEELKLLEEDFERNSSSNSDLTLLFKKRLLLQALLVMRRIFSQANLGHPHWLYLESFLGYESNETSSDMRDKIFRNTNLFIFEQLNGYNPKLLSRRSFDVFTSTIFRTLFCLQIDNNLPQGEEHLSDNLARAKVTFDDLLALTKFIATFSEFFSNPAMISSFQFPGYHFGEIVYHSLCLLESLSSRITNQKKPQLEETLSYFIRNFFPERTTTVLHVAAKEVEMILDSLSDESMIPIELQLIHTQIKLILQLGADPNAIDRKGRTPLHILAGIKEHHLNAEYLPIFQTLVDAGSNLYLAADNRETVISFLKEIVERDQNDDGIPSQQHYFDSLINSDVFPLTCLCARVIRRHRIPFKDRLPLILQKLISI